MFEIGTSVIGLLALAFMSIQCYRLGRKNENVEKAMAGLKVSLGLAQGERRDLRDVCRQYSADIRRVRTRAKYFVDLLNALGKEPFSRRKREAFFKDVRDRGLDCALSDFELKFGTRIERAQEASERYVALKAHRKAARDTRLIVTKENQAVLEVLRGAAAEREKKHDRS